MGQIPLWDSKLVQAINTAQTRYLDTLEA